MIEAVVKRVAGLDVHKDTVVVTVLCEQADGVLQRQTRSFATVRRALEALAGWLLSEHIELCAMESTGVYWKSVYAALERAGLRAYVVNARHVKHVPGRKTDVQDSEWLAELARCGLLHPSFVPAQDLRELRALARYRQKVVGMLSAEKNRLHKALDECGIRLGSVVSDIEGCSARAMIEALIAGRSIEETAALARGRLKAKRADLEEALQGELGARYRLLLEQQQAHIRYLEGQIRTLDQALVAGMAPYEREWRLLQTLPGVDELAAALLLIEIGPDMERFGSAKRLSAWAGMCPGNHESAGKRQSGRMPRGNRWVRRVLCEVANSARCTQSQFKGLYQGLVIRRGHKRAIMAVGHKVLEIAFVLLRKHEPYRDPGLDYEALVVRRNAPRWLQALQRYGYLPKRQAAV